jgi:hypothetical protein
MREPRAEKTTTRQSLIELLGRGWDREILHRYLDPLIPLLDQHDRDFIANGVLTTTVRLLTDEPAVVNQLQPSRIVARLAGLAADAVGTAQDFQQFWIYHIFLLDQEQCLKSCLIL